MNSVVSLSRLEKNIVLVLQNQAEDLVIYWEYGLGFLSNLKVT